MMIEAITSIASMIIIIIAHLPLLLVRIFAAPVNLLHTIVVFGTFESKDLIITGLLFCLTIVIICLCVTRIPHGTFAVLERFGVFNRVLHPGMYLLLPPPFDNIRRVKWTAREGSQIIFHGTRIPSGDLFFGPISFHPVTSDNRDIYIQITPHLRIASLERAVYDVYDVFDSMTHLICGTVCEYVCTHTYDEIKESHANLVNIVTGLFAENIWGINLIGTTIYVRLDKPDRT